MTIESNSESTSSQPLSVSISDTPPHDYEWVVTKDYLFAAIHAYGFGLRVIPISPGTKKNCSEVGPMGRRYWPRENQRLLAENPEHEVAFIVGDDILVFDADSPEATVALKAIEKRFGFPPIMVVKTSKGEHQ